MMPCSVACDIGSVYSSSVFGSTGHCWICISVRPAGIPVRRVFQREKEPESGRKGQVPGFFLLSDVFPEPLKRQEERWSPFLKPVRAQKNPVKRRDTQTARPGFTRQGLPGSGHGPFFRTIRAGGMQKGKKIPYAQGSFTGFRQEIRLVYDTGGKPEKPCLQAERSRCRHPVPAGTIPALPWAWVHPR